MKLYQLLFCAVAIASGVALALRPNSSTTEANTLTGKRTAHPALANTSSPMQRTPYVRPHGEDAARRNRESGPRELNITEQASLRDGAANWNLNPAIVSQLGSVTQYASDGEAKLVADCQLRSYLVTRTGNPTPTVPVSLQRVTLDNRRQLWGTQVAEKTSGLSIRLLSGTTTIVNSGAVIEKKRFSRERYLAETGEQFRAEMGRLLEGNDADMERAFVLACERDSLEFRELAYKTWRASKLPELAASAPFGERRLLAQASERLLRKPNVVSRAPTRPEPLPELPGSVDDLEDLIAKTRRKVGPKLSKDDRVALQKRLERWQSWVDHQPQDERARKVAQSLRQLSYDLIKTSGF